METEAAARARIDAWSRAWPASDPEPLRAVYAEDAVLRSAPLRDPHHGGEGVLSYARSAFADQDAFVGCRFGEPLVAGDRAAVDWWAGLVESGREVTLAGVSLLRFDRAGRVVEQRDVWAYGAARERAPGGLGRVAAGATLSP